MKRIVLFLVLGVLVLVGVGGYLWQARQTTVYFFQNDFSSQKKAYQLDKQALAPVFVRLGLDIDQPQLVLPISQRVVRPRQIRVVLRPLSQLPSRAKTIDPVYRQEGLYRVITEAYQLKPKRLTFTVYQAELPAAKAALELNQALAFFRPLFISRSTFQAEALGSWLELIRFLRQGLDQGRPALVPVRFGFSFKLLSHLRPKPVYAGTCSGKYACDPVKYALKCADGTICFSEGGICLSDGSTCASRPDGCDTLSRDQFSCSGATENACYASAACGSNYCSPPGQKIMATILGWAMPVIAVVCERFPPAHLRF